MGVQLVTGATGFIGNHVVRALLDRGEEVRCLVRPTSDRRLLADLPVEIAIGDVLDPRALEESMRGVETVYHTAADYRLYAREPDELHRTNVEGTRNVLESAARGGVARVVHTSSVGALGLRPDGQPADESTPVRRSELIGAYKKSKYDAERLAEEWSRRGLDVVIVNPSTPVGEGDIKPTPTGKMIVDFLAGRMPALVDTGLNLVDVRDVAVGHLLAAERGKPGEKYILGGENLSLEEILARLAAIAGRGAPKIVLPHWIPIAIAAIDTARARLFGGTPRVPLEGARLARHRMFFDSSKAVRELGLPRHPVDGALERAVTWFTRAGYA